MRDALVASTAELASASADWEDLAARVRASPFLRPGWVAAWWNAFGKGRLELRIVRRAQDGRLAALLPVRLRRGVLDSPTNWHSPEFGVLSESPEAARLLLAELFRERRRRVSLAFLGPDQAGVLREAAAAGSYRLVHRTLQRSPYVAIDRDWDGYERLLGKKTCDRLRRKQRRLAKRGAVTVEVTAGERLAEALEEGYEVEASGWKTANGTAIRSSPASLRFYTEVARWAAERGWLRLAFLRLDGRALAFDYCLELEGVHYVVKTGYDAARQELGPGKLLRHAMLARAFQAGLRSYELLGDDDPWKLEWTESTRPRELVQCFRPSPAGMLDWSVYALGRPLAKRVRDLARARLRPGARASPAPQPGQPDEESEAPPATT